MKYKKSKTVFHKFTWPTLEYLDPDHFTTYAQVYPTRSKEAKTAASESFSDYTLRFGNSW